MKKIGVFDSGVGGITVLMELKKAFPSVEYVYLGDTAHLPYGAKSPAQIEKLSVDCAHTLKKQQIDALVVACNTASSLALEAIQRAMDPIPVFGVVEPGVEAALAAMGSAVGPAGGPASLLKGPASILILATRATIRSHAYRIQFQKELAAHPVLKTSPITVLEQACPLLVPLIEEGWIDHPILHQTIAEYVKPHATGKKHGIALLACTHYPWIHSAFEKALPGWTVVNSAQAVVRALTHSPAFVNRAVSAEDRPGVIDWHFTDPEVVPEFAKEYLAQLRG